jgi:hypothetical protein
MYSLTSAALPPAPMRMIFFIDDCNLNLVFMKLSLKKDKKRHLKFIIYIKTSDCIVKSDFEDNQIIRDSKLNLIDVFNKSC